jgi:hypothetical protein
LPWVSAWVLAAVSWRLAGNELVSSRVWHHSRSPGVGVSRGSQPGGHRKDAVRLPRLLWSAGSSYALTLLERLSEKEEEKETNEESSIRMAGASASLRRGNRRLSGGNPVVLSRVAAFTLIQDVGSLGKGREHHSRSPGAGLDGGREAALSARRSGSGVFERTREAAGLPLR